MRRRRASGWRRRSGVSRPARCRSRAARPASLRRLLELLGEARCLLVLDNVETVLQPGGPVGGYRAGYERYGTLLRQVGEAPHRSCLIMTSREEPSEVRLLRGDGGPVRALDLGGLGVEDGRALLRDKQLDGDETAWQALIQRYGGNGLALRVVGETIRELFGGSVADYLDYATAAPGVMVGGLRELLDVQMQRLSDTEQELLRRMAVAREPVGVAELAADLGPRIGRAATLEAAEGLRRRSLLERTEGGRLFGLHSVVLEYVTEQLIEDVAQELASGDLDPPAAPAPDEGDGEGVRPPEPGAADLRPDRGAARRHPRERPGGRAAAGRPAGHAARATAGGAGIRPGQHRQSAAAAARRPEGR